MKSFIKVLWLVAGVVLTLAGVATFFKPLSTFVAASYIVGGAFIISGLLSIVGYFAGRGVMLGAGWVLAEGILSFIFGTIICFDEYSKGVIAVSVGILVGIWLIVSGINSLSRSFDMHHLQAKGWGWLTCWGLLCITAGVAALCKPIVATIGIVDTFVGIVMIIGGVATMSRCLTRDVE